MSSSTAGRKEPNPFLVMNESKVNNVDGGHENREDPSRKMDVAGAKSN